ncbi:MAG: amidohydrolase [Myxococcales bacterium]|nr:amidohydrolase [Myxococcales bacterium]MCB9533234.1 amidohydrolase [Myxococcales bacterium]
MKIDIHTHILPERWPDLRERYGYGGWISLDHHAPCRARMMSDDRFFREVESNCWSPAQRLTECDSFGVDVQVLSTVPVMFGYWARPEHTHDLSILLNDHIAEVCAWRPDRFVGLGTVPLQDANRAVSELERCMRVLGLVGVQIGTHINGIGLDDESLFPFYEAAEDLGAALFVHPWDMMGKERLSNYWLQWLVSMPAETSQAICSIMMGGVLERFPRLRWAFAHGGGSFPATLGRIDHGFDVRPDLCQTRTTTRPSALLDRIYLDSLVHDERVLRYLLDVVGEQRIALGSDYPFPLGELAPGAMIEAMNLPPSTKERLLSGSALEWLGLTRERFETASSRAHSERLRGA